MGENGSGYTRPTKKGNIPYFGKAILKYGWENISHEILHTGLSRKEANELEQFYILFLNLMNPLFGYNQAKGGNNHSMGEEGRKNLSKAHLGQKAWNKGIPMSENSKKKSSISHKKHPSKAWLGKKFSDKHKEALKEAWKKRKEKGLGGWSDEQREKYIETMKKSPYKHSEEVRKRISEKNKGKTITEETRRKLSLKIKGRVMGEEHGRKVREGMQRAKERRKNGIS